jgi:site-specific recombinase XerD
MISPSLGQVICSFFQDHLVTLKGLRRSSVLSYRDAIRLFLAFTSADARRRITKLSFEDLTAARVQEFLRYLEKVRHNHIRTRNQRLAALHVFFEYLAAVLPGVVFDGPMIHLVDGHH